MGKQIPLSVPNLNMNIVENLKECIETGWVSTGGRFITEFEKKVADYVGVLDAVSAQSGTAGLHVALRILGVEAGHEVIVPTLTFVAAVNPVKYIGAEPVFMDCDDSLCIDPVKLERFCKEECRFESWDLSDSGKETSGNDKRSGTTKVLINKKTGRRVSAIIVVHIFGNLANMEAIIDIADRYGIQVLEDATEALGSYVIEGRYKGYHAGTMGHMGVYSFNANKIITTGGGGMIVSRNQKYLDKARYLTITAKNNSEEDVLFFVHGEVGYNYRMLNLQAALGVSQIDELEDFIKVKTRNFKIYKERLHGAYGMELLSFKEEIRANHWFYSLLIDNRRCELKTGDSSQAESNLDRNTLMHKLIEKGIQCRPIWKLIHTLEPYKDSQSYEIEKASYYADHILNIPCSSNLTKEDAEYVCEGILELMGQKL